MLWTCKPQSLGGESSTGTEAECAGANGAGPVCSFQLGDLRGITIFANAGEAPHIQVLPSRGPMGSTVRHGIFCSLAQLSAFPRSHMTDHDHAGSF